MFYLDYDTRRKMYFIAPVIQPKIGKWLIEFSNRSAANDFLKKLTFGQIETPDRNALEFKVKSIEEDGQVTIYIPRSL